MLFLRITQNRKKNIVREKLEILADNAKKTIGELFERDRYKLSLEESL